jgi:general secretion pathway protein F/type IV pilus assembly protein PilC
MQSHPRAFGEMAISMVRAGGEGGFLEDALSRVAMFTEQQQDLKGRTTGALAYPVFLGVVGVAVVTGLIVFFVPQFEGLFERLRARGELPALTEGLLALSHAIGSWGWLLAIILIGAGIFLKNKLQTDAGRIWSDRVKLKIPIIGNIFQNLAVARFCPVLGTLLHNGVPILRSLEISSWAAGNKVLAGAITAAAENISAGQSLAKPLQASGYFPTEVVEMIAVAEESNTLETVLTNVADSLEKRTFRRLELFVRLLEPMMLLLLASVVLCVVIALLMPVLKMSTTM